MNFSISVLLTAAEMLRMQILGALKLLFLIPCQVLFLHFPLVVFIC